MAVYEVFSHPELRRYKTQICTKASLLMVIIIALTFIPPLFVVYRSNGFWLKEANYREVPDVKFKKELLLILDTEGVNNFITYSTLSNYTKLMQRHVRIPFIMSREEDINGDGRADKLIFNLEMPMTNADKVYGVKLLLFFYYRLHKFSSLVMESMAYIGHDSSKAGGEIQVFGDLVVKQKQALSHRGVDSRYNTSIIDTASTYADAYKLSTIFKNYQSRNVTTMLDSTYIEWTTSRASDQPFKMNVEINYPEGVFLYTPGFWYLIKWGWVQYASVLILFLYVFGKVKIFIFQNQLVTTVVHNDNKLAKLS